MLKKIYLSVFVFAIFIFTQSVFAFGKKDSKKTEIVKEIEVETPVIVQEIVPSYEPKQVTGEVVEVKESWGYVMQDRADEYKSEFPLTDVCLFAADFNCYGEMIDIPKRKLLKTPKNTRVHFVVICDSRSLTHFVINDEFGIKSKALDAIVSAAAEFDGIQLDFELIPTKDKNAYLKFIDDLRAKMPKNQILSVCVPARMRIIQDEPFPYAEIAKRVDRIFVMAYDEHWSGSKPGPIATTDWSKKVVEFAKTQIPTEKLIMGLPFYGRTWASKSHAGAWYHSGAQRVMRENNVAEVTYENDIPKFSYKAEIEVTGYFNDAYSCIQLARIYKEAGMQNLGFWRVGHEDPTFWKWIKISE